MVLILLGVNLLRRARPSLFLGFEERTDSFFAIICAVVSWEESLKVVTSCGSKVRIV